jgi:ABC-2 type transport system ATP-binding protein
VTLLEADVSAASVNAPEAQPTSVVALDHVARSFGDAPALRDLTLRVEPGTITTLLGPNGAGKTTAVRTITGALAPDHGSVRVFGVDPSANPADGESVRRRCGVVAAKPALYDRLTGADNLRYAAELYGLGRGAPIHEAAERFGIAGALDQQVGGYSTGMKTRLALARSVLLRPDLLLLDEPTSGLDPESSVAVLSLIRQLSDDGVTVVMCTHLLLEAEGLADQVVVLEDGADLVTGRPEELVRRYWPGAIVRLDAENRAELEAARLEDVVGVIAVTTEPGKPDGPLSVQLDDAARIPDLVAHLVAGGARLTRVEPYTPSLEDLYFAVRGLRRTTEAAR